MLSIKVQSWVEVILRSVIILLLGMVVFVFGTPAAKILLRIAVLCCFLIVTFDLYHIRHIRRGTAEQSDERDQKLMQIAAERAILLNQIIMVILAVFFLLMCVKNRELLTVGILFAIIGINLPLLLKHGVFLYLEQNDQGEYFE